MYAHCDGLHDLTFNLQERKRRDDLFAGRVVHDETARLHHNERKTRCLMGSIY